MFMIMEEENRPELRKVIDDAMESVPKLRARFAGKTIPPEKYAITMAERYNNGEKDPGKISAICGEWSQNLT